MILRENAQEPVKEHGTLFVRNVIDALRMLPNSEDGLPTGHWVGADHRVLCPQTWPNILR